jgi:hypothetical protein
MESTASEMSNLVGMYAFLIKEEKIRARVFIRGKANNTYFICQVISAMTGEPNIAKLMTAQELVEWVIIPTQDLANSIYNDYCDSGRWRYGLSW